MRRCPPAYEKPLVDRPPYFLTRPVCMHYFPDSIPLIEFSPQHPTRQEEIMDKWECPCGYVYDPIEGDIENNIPSETPFEELPDEWVCPLCGAEKEYFEKLD